MATTTVTITIAITFINHCTCNLYAYMDLNSKIFPPQDT